MLPGGLPFHQFNVLLNNYFEDQRQKDNAKSEKVKSARMFLGMKRKFHNMGSPTSHNKLYVVSDNTSTDTNSPNSHKVHKNVPAKRIQVIASDKNTIVKDIRKTNVCYENNVLTNMNNEDEPQVELKRRALNKAKLRKRLRKENETQYKVSQRMQKSNFRMRQTDENYTLAKLKAIKMSMTYKTRQRPEPFHLFLSGGAGVGKSHLVQTIVQTANR